MCPAICATRAGSGEVSAGALLSAGGAVWSCSWLAAVSSSAWLPSAGSLSGWVACPGPGSSSACAGAPLASSCWSEASCSAAAGASPGWPVAVCSSSCPGPAAGSVPDGPGAARVQVSGMPGLPPLVRVASPAASSAARASRAAGRLIPAAVAMGGGGAGAGGQRGVDGRCGAAGDRAGSRYRGGVRRGVRRATGRAGGAGGVLRACHFRFSISFPAAFLNACFRLPGRQSLCARREVKRLAEKFPAPVNLRYGAAKREFRASSILAAQLASTFSPRRTRPLQPGVRCSGQTGSLPDKRNLGTELIFTSTLFNRYGRFAFLLDLRSPFPRFIRAGLPEAPVMHSDQRACLRRRQTDRPGCAAWLTSSCAGLPGSACGTACTRVRGTPHAAPPGASTGG